jgi:hypothetical protein
MTLTQLMQTAHLLKREYRCTMSVALRMSWGLARGFSRAVEASFVDWNGRIVRREVYLGNSSDEANAARRAAEKVAKRDDLRCIPGTSVNLNFFAPAVAVEAVRPVAMKRAA